MRHDNRRNVEWRTPDELATWDLVGIEVLMDIREELQRIRRILECHNTQAGFFAMQAINKRLAKRFPLRRKAP